MTPFLGRVALVTVALIGVPWLASAVGTAITGVSDSPETSSGAGSEGEVGPAPLVTISAVPRSATPRATPLKASRTRVLGRPESGTLQEITCYASGSITASGKTPRVGMVATLDRSIPFGTVVRIDSLGTYVVEDRIGHSSDYDIYGPSKQFCRKFGRKRLAVEVVR